MHGSEASEGLLKGYFRPRSTILEVLLAVKTSLRGFFGYARVLGLRRTALGQFKAAINDFKGILIRWDF